NAVDGIPEDGITAVSTTTGLPTWATGTNADAVEVDTLAVSGSTVYAGGNFGSIGGQSRTCLAALDATSGSATPWDPTLSSQYGCYVKSLALSGGIVYVDGGFDSVDGQSRPGLAAIDATSGSPTAWDPQVKPCCSAGPLAVSGSTVYVGLSAIDANTGSFTSWNPKPNRGALAVAVPGSTVYAG